MCVVSPDGLHQIYSAETVRTTPIFFVDIWVPRRGVDLQQTGSRQHSHVVNRHFFIYFICRRTDMTFRLAAFSNESVLL